MKKTVNEVVVVNGLESQPSKFDASKAIEELKKAEEIMERKVKVQDSDLQNRPETSSSESVPSEDPGFVNSMASEKYQFFFGE